MPEILSDVEQETLGLIKTSIAANGYAPSVGELSEQSGITTTATMGRLTRLERKGYIRRAPHRARAITIVDNP